MIQSPAPDGDGAAGSEGRSVVVAESSSDKVTNQLRPPMLRGVSIPTSSKKGGAFSRKVERAVVELYSVNVHLQRADLWAVVRYVELTFKYRGLSAFIERRGVDEDSDYSGLLTGSFEPRKVLVELRALAGELLRHERDLGLLPSARAALGVDLHRMRQLAQGSQEPVDEAEIAALEGRLVDRLRGDDADDTVRDAARDARERR